MQERRTVSNVNVERGRSGWTPAGALALRRHNVRTFAATVLAVAGAALLALWGNDALAASGPGADGAIRILLPFPPTGPRDIQGAERATRTYRAISAHAPQPITDALADVTVMAASGIPGVRVLRVRQPSHRNRMDLAAYDASFDARRSIVLVSHESLAIAHAGSSPEPDWIAPLAIMPLALIVAPAMTDVDRWRRQPTHAGRLLRLGSAGGRSASHFAGTLLSNALDIRMLHVSYNGGHAALNALAAQEIDLTFTALPLALPYIEAGRLPVLGLASARRFELLPQLPTLSEAGVATIEWEGWFALYASRALAPNLRASLTERLSSFAASGAVRAALLARGLQPADPADQDFARRVARERERVARRIAAEE